MSAPLALTNALGKAATPTRAEPHANRPSLLLQSDSSPIMSQTMEHTDSSSIRENEEPDKKQKSRRPPSTCAGRDCVAKVALLMNGG